MEPIFENALKWEKSQQKQYTKQFTKAYFYGLLIV